MTSSGAQLRPVEPLFISVPPRPQRLLHSEAYIKCVFSEGTVFVCWNLNGFYTGTLFYLTTLITFLSYHFMWQQVAQFLLLFQFAVSSDKWISFECVSVNIMLLFTDLK